MSTRWRIDVGSWSTFGQTALLILATLLVTQAFSLLLLRGLTEQWQSAAFVQPAVTRFAEVAEQVSRASGVAREQFLSIASGRDQQFRLEDSLDLPHLPQRTALADSLSEALQKRGVRVLAMHALMRGAFDGPPPIGNFNPNMTPPRMTPPGRDPRFRPFLWRPHGPGFEHLNDEVVLAVRLADGKWLTGRFLVQRPRALLLNPFVVSEVALFVALLGIALFWASQISKPLRLLARAAEDLRPQEAPTPIPEKGPRDVRTAIVSFNAMARRVRDLVQEKDRMLSAISHDLRTPLASLKLRAESMEPEAERLRLIDTIDEMTGMVDEILSLARLGHSKEVWLLVDLSALADSLVEEYRELGKDVTFLEAPRIPLTMQPTLVRRLLRNLIDNAVKYGERARVSVTSTSDAVCLVVEDDGPGIPVEALTDVLQPFTRLEQSRSRETGGMGLGLSIADAIARGQGAILTLENISPAGLRASVKWPRTAAAASEIVN
jgi:signal transduction histidine kinase